MNKFSFAVLISGNGTNLESMVNSLNEKKISGRICCVLSNKEEAYGLVRAKKAGIPTEVVLNEDYGTREEFDNKLVNVLSKAI